MALGAGIGGVAGGLLGSLVPLPGATFAGGALGSLLGGYFDQPDASLSETLYGKPGGYQSLSPYTDWQQKYFQDIAQQGFQGLQDPYAGFEPLAQYARTQFQQQTIPSIAERFGAMTGGGLSSPGFAQQLGQAGAGLEQGLAAQKAAYGLQNRSQLMNLLQMGLTPQYNYVQSPGQPGLAQGFLGSAGPTLGRLGANAYGAYIGAQPGQGRQAVTESIAKLLQNL